MRAAGWCTPLVGVVRTLGRRLATVEPPSLSPFAFVMGVLILGAVVVPPTASAQAEVAPTTMSVATATVSTDAPMVQPASLSSRVATCAWCTEGGWYGGGVVHIWEGECVDIVGPPNPACRTCTSEYCDDPSVPHAGPCPEVYCAPEFTLEEWEDMKRSWDMLQFIHYVETVTLAPDSGMVKVMGCDGRVLLYMPANEVTLDVLEVIFVS